MNDPNDNRPRVPPITRPRQSLESVPGSRNGDDAGDSSGEADVFGESTGGISAGDRFFEIGAMRTPEQVRKSELIAAVRGIENKSTGGFTKFIVLVASLAVFVAAGVAWWDPWVVSMLVAVLLLHEAGHYIAMRLFGYRNVKMFFIPFLGAAVSGRHFNISGWKKALVYLAGPVPGIVVSLPLMACGIGFDTQWMFELGAMGLLLNTLNLLPIMPLDGGWIMHLTVFSRSPILELVARLLGIASMFAFAYFTGSKFILFIAIPLVLSLSTTYQVAKLIRRLRDRALPQPERDEIPDAAIRLLDDEIQNTPLAPTPTANRAAIIVQMYESLIVRPPGIGATLAIWAVYGGAFLLAIVGGLGVLVSRDLIDSGLFDRDMFDSVEHQVPLDVDNTQFHLGTQPVGETSLAVARFDSAAGLEAATRRLAPTDLEKFTHARFDNVWIASITKTELTVDGLAPDDALDEEFADEMEGDAPDFDRIRSLFEPVDPSDTWIAGMVPASNERIDPAVGTPIVCVVSGLHHSSLRIRAIAPNAALAESVAENHFQMPGIGGSKHYLPPWSPLDPPTPQQLECRNVLKRLIDGITPETAPELWKKRQQIADEQSKSYQKGAVAPQEAAKFAEQFHDLQTQYIENVSDTLEGDQAKIAQMYQQYQAAAQNLNEQDDPLMHDYLIDEANLLGFADPSRRSYHFASHVTGTVLSADDLLDEHRKRLESGEQEDAMSLRASGTDAGGRVLDLFVHQATDQAATISSVIAFLKNLGFESFELRYVTPKAASD